MLERVNHALNNVDVGRTLRHFVHQHPFDQDHAIAGDSTPVSAIAMYTSSAIGCNRSTGTGNVTGRVKVVMDGPPMGRAFPQFREAERIERIMPLACARIRWRILLPFGAQESRALTAIVPRT